MFTRRSSRTQMVCVPEIVCAATYLKNRTITNTIENKTPYEIFFKKRPNVENLRLYGSKVFVRNPEQKRFSKWDEKSNMGILLGYSEVGYRVLLNNKVVVARNVEFVEENVKCIGLDLDENDTEYTHSSTSTFEESRSNSENNSDDNVFESADESEKKENENKEKVE